MSLTTYLNGEELKRYTKLDSMLQFFTIITPTKAIGHIAHIAVNFMTPGCFVNLLYSVLHFVSFFFHLSRKHTKILKHFIFIFIKMHFLMSESFKGTNCLKKTCEIADV